MRRLGMAALLVATVLMGAPAADADVSNTRHYSNQTLYGNPSSSDIKAPPAGYELAYLETLGRHGARSVTNNDAEQRALAVWRSASRKGVLTSKGKRFDNDVLAFTKAEKKLGYGYLSTVGKAEWRGIGRRTADNYKSFLSSTNGEIDFSTTPIYRTKQSASELRAGISGEVRGLDMQPRVTDKSLLIDSGSSRAGKAAIDNKLKQSNVRNAASKVLRRIYSKKFVSSLSDPVGKAMDIYLLYCTAPGMRGETNVTFSRYVSAADAHVLASVKDAQNFYRYGPGVAGERSSYKQADPVLEDFFDSLDARIAGGNQAAKFRLAHGETTMPFAARIKLKGSSKQASKRSPYSYGNNSWRGYVAGRLGGNIEWAAYKKGTSWLVTMRYNEQPVRFNNSCTASTLNPYFYRVSQLKSCLR